VRVRFEILDNAIYENIFMCSLAVPTFDMKLAAIYKPPDVPDEISLKFLDERLKNSNKYVYFGDFNFDLLSNENRVKKYTDTVQVNRFHFLNRISSNDYTNFYKQRDKKTIIDHVFTDLTRLEFNFVNNIAAVSSHSCIILNIKTTQKKSWVE
jgi:hypothetical protein